jgi:hypothetical protein
MSDNAVIDLAWVEALCTRHSITLRARGKRLEVLPKSAFNSVLTNEERATLKAHRAAIVTLLNAQGGTIRPAAVAAEAAPPSPPALASAPAPVVCRYCMRECVGREHPAFATFHANDEEEQWRALAEQRDRDLRESELRRQYGLPSPTWE